MKFDLEKMIGKKINCDTEEKTKQLFIFLDEQGYRWWGSNGRLIYEKTNWEDYERNTCYCIDKDKTITFCSTKYSEYETLNFEDIIIPDQPKLCEILGIEFNKPYNIKGYEHNPIKVKCLNDNGEITVVDKWGLISSKTLVELIEHPELIEKIPEWTEKQKEIFKALRMLGFKYITRDIDSKNVWVYILKPEKRDDYWDSDIDDEGSIGLSHISVFLDFIDWEDEEPFEIPDLE